MDVPRYLERINLKGPVSPDRDSLARLHRAHMLSVPFENLDIVPLHRPLVLTQEALWDKIVTARRSGFCYELNGLFADLLRAIGFRVTYLNARVYGEDGSLGIDFDHLALLVDTAISPERWLVDVGFGDSFTEPLDFSVNGEQPQEGRSYRLEPEARGYTVAQLDYHGSWRRLYCFDLKPRRFPADYEAACIYHQTSPQSSFTRGSIVSRATQDGRISLEDESLIITRRGTVQRRPVREGEYAALLKRYFGVVLNPE
jgi:N-hydroxyarylamine O-acetyltransferase